jgi:hypothetical protein
LPEVVNEEGKARAAAGSGEQALARGIVVAGLTVDANGDARNPVIVESDPPGLLDEQVIRAVKDMVFRPRLVDGEAVSSESVQFRHEFLYEPRRAAAEDSAGSADGPSRDEGGSKGEPLRYPDSADEAPAGGEPARQPAGDDDKNST